MVLYLLVESSFKMQLTFLCALYRAFIFYHLHLQHWPAMPPVSLAVQCICTVIQELARPHSADSTFPLIPGVQPHQVRAIKVCFVVFFLAFQTEFFHLHIVSRVVFFRVSVLVFSFWKFLLHAWHHICSHTFVSWSSVQFLRNCANESL